MFVRPMIATVGLLTVGAAPMFAQHTHVPTPSTWTLNVKESDFGGGPPMKSDVQVITVDTEKRLVWTDTMVDAAGRAARMSWDGPEDGTVVPIKGMHQAKASWDAATDTGTLVDPEGNTYDQKLTLSKDGKKQIMTVVMKDTKGKVYHQKLVYDRTK